LCQSPKFQPDQILRASANDGLFVPKMVYDWHEELRVEDP